LQSLRPVRRVAELLSFDDKVMTRCPFILLLSCCIVCQGAVSKPLLVIIGTNRWRMVIGSDSPRFAFYEDGTVIYSAEKATANEPFRSRTVPDAKQKADELLAFDVGKMKKNVIR
jgi:hypothetical protein